MKDFISTFNETPMKQEDKRDFVIVSLTINPNITNMNDDQREKFVAAGKYFFSQNILTKYFNSDDVESIQIIYNLEKGHVVKHDHFQVAIMATLPKGNKIKFNVDKMQIFWDNVVNKTLNCSQRKCYIGLTSKIDYNRMIQQYVKK